VRALPNPCRGAAGVGSCGSGIGAGCPIRPVQGSRGECTCRLLHHGRASLWLVALAANGARAEAERRGNLYPTKARPEQRTDAAVTLIMAIGLSTTEPKQFASIFERAELWSA
jgi:hypothetical protein